MNFKYEMEQLPPNIEVSASKETGAEAAQYLQNLVNRRAQSGWDFYRVDSIGVASKPGCIEALLSSVTGGILGKKEQFHTYYVVTFRRPE